MKKHILLIFTTVLVLGLLSGCRRKDMVTPTTVPTRPLATIPPATTEAPTVYTTAPTVTTVPTRPAVTTSPTIEDGNGPVAGQTTTP